MNPRVEEICGEGILDCPAVVLADPWQKRRISKEVHRLIYRPAHL